MPFNFDEEINRAGTNCYKYDMRKDIFNTEDVLPMWVADGDFKAPEAVIKAIEERLHHGIFGYTFKGDDYFEAIINWNKMRHGWNIKKEWIHYSPGVVPSLNLAVTTLTEPGDEVIIQSPVYFPFYSAVTTYKRKILRNPLVLNNEGRYEMNLQELEEKISTRTKLLFLCSPHNPTGNVWKKEELEALCNLCIKNNITIVSDEIHADLIFPGNKHIPTAKLSEEISQNTITFMAPSKTFNIAGLSSSYMVSENEELLNKVSKPLKDLHLTHGNIFGITATVAAYNNGSEWLDAQMNYFTDTLKYVNQFVDNELPQVKLIQPEGTYLLWFDFRSLNLKQEELNKLLITKAKVGLSDGAVFGKEGIGFERMNIACPRSSVIKALKMIKSALN